MTDDELIVFKIRRDLEKQGIKWTDKVSMSTLMGVADSIGKSFGKLTDRIAELEKRLVLLQKTLDHVDKHALVFSGDWQPDRTYYPGNLVRFKGATFTALRNVVPRRDAPDVHGSGWSQVS